jgi:N-methylhydantoinase B
VSEAEAAHIYGVVLATDGDVDGPATDARRAAIRAERTGSSAAPAAARTDGAGATALDGLAEVVIDGRRGARCRRCGTVRVADEGDLIGAMPTRSLPLRAAGPHVGDGRNDPGFNLELRSCPACGRSLDVVRVRSAHVVRAKSPEG